MENISGDLKKCIGFSQYSFNNIKIGTYESVQRCGKISKDLRMSKNKGMTIYMMPKE